MWLHKVKHPLQEHAYALFPLITIATVVIISCRIAALSRSHMRHRPLPSPWSTIVSFGDAFSDSGNGARITGGKYPSEPWFWHHRFTNGPNWVDNLILDLGGLGKIKMRNFAHGGATTDNALMPGNLLGHTIPGIHQQVRGFMLKSRQTGYPKTESTLYTIWTGASDSLALGGVGSYKKQHKGSVDDIEESIYQDILQLERDSHSKVKYVLVLTPPPVQDMPMVRHEGQGVRHAVQHAAESLNNNLPLSLYRKFKSMGHTTLTDSKSMSPVHPPPHTLPGHRKMAAAPITHYLTVDLPQNYDHMLPHEHNGTKKPVPMHPRPLEMHPHQPLFRHTEPSPIEDPRHRLPKVAKRSITGAKSNAVHPASGKASSHKLHVMVYDAYNFVKHAESNPRCFGLDPLAMGKPCKDPKHCHDRVWMDDSNLSSPIHYWMARDINMRLHMWHMHTTGHSPETSLKNSTRVSELGLEMLGYACPMRPAPVL
ncbi:hypothetical protein GGF46_005335 [Coemansia sp. RSA 552]|nr:hypothetical protein GGF46_005335 [Coemansia sp. RSA 552]